jgi:hypothetical protein
VRFIDPPPAGTYAAVLLAPLSEDSGEGIEYIRDLALTGCKITDPSVLRPCMGKPAEKVPFLSSFFGVFYYLYHLLRLSKCFYTSKWTKFCL